MTLLSSKRLKNGDLGNCRLLSLASIPRKVMEKLVLEVISGSKKKKILRSSQYGFNNGKSCLINLINF